MNYSKIQKFISSLIIFALLFGTTFRIPLLQFSTHASSKEFFSLVALVVEEEIYSDIKNEVERYGEDIQGVLENTKVVIMPTPGNTPAFNIASMLESLYFDGYNGLSKVDFESELIGTVLVGNFNLPQVFEQEQTSKTILPYTDFIDKKYIYNNNTNKYEDNKNNIEGIKSEIWHGVISPNLRDENENINAIKDYFDKNHDFYRGTGNFKFSEGIINGNNTTGVKSDYEPFVFYFDNFNENKSLNYESYESYLAYLENKEDIVYDRFTKELAAKITEKLLGSQIDTISDLISNVDPSFDITGFNNTLDRIQTPDIQTRNIIEETTRMFIQAFSEGTIGEFRSDVHNAGRYNSEGAKVNADFVPYLITVLDLVNDEVVKKGNELLEDKIDDIVKTKLQKNIYVPSLINQASYSGTSVASSGLMGTGTGASVIYLENFLYGKQVKDILVPEQCSIFRGSISNTGSGKLVEANRGYNYKLVEGDVNKLKSESISCLNGINNKTSLLGYWGHNTPLNSDFSGGVPTLLSHDVQKSITPLFDIDGSYNVSDKIGSYPIKPVLNNSYSYLDCEESNFIKTREWIWEEGGDNSGGELVLDYQIPVDGKSRIDWTCRSEAENQIYSKTYEQLFLEKREYITEDINNLPVGSTLISIGAEGNNLVEESKCNGLICIDGSYRITFKKIPSYIEHKSPTFEEIDSQMKNMITPDLPVDKDRFIDFKSVATNLYQKINYPYLFRLGVVTGEELNIENIDKSLKNLLNPYILKLEGENLYDYINSQSSINGNYLDNLNFAIYWNNLGVSGKYKFVFENYLSFQNGLENYDFGLVKNKDQYEIAYLGSNGDASNMYILLDPESKGKNPYADIIAKNQSLKSSLLGINTNQADENSEEGVFKCAPPEGVPLWQWFPAIMCRIGNMLPPTISITTDSCSSSSSTLSDEDLQYILENGGDTNKNGIIDCIELKLAGGELSLKSDASKYYYGTLGTLKSEIKDSAGNIVTLDSSTNINFELIKVYTKKDENEEFTELNRKLIYNKNGVELSSLNNLEALKEVNKYIDFSDGVVRAKYGFAEKSFVVKNKDADFVFKTSYEVENFNKEVEFREESEDLIIKVRGDRLFISSYKVSTDIYGIRGVDNGLSSVLVSDKDNVFISNISASDNSLFVGVDSSSTAKEKLILNLLNFDSDSNNIDLEFPIEIEILRNGEKIIETKNIINNIEGFISLGSFEKSGSYEFIINDNFGYTIKKQIEILPEKSSKIDINNSTSIIETGGNIVTNVLSIFDKYDNLAAGEFYTIELEIIGDGLVFESDNEFDNKNIEYSIYDGYKIYKLISTDDSDINIINYTVKDYSGEELFKQSDQIKTVNKIYTIINPLFSDVKIGGGEYSYELLFKDDNGNLLTDFNSRIYLNIPTIYGTSTKNYFEVINGKAVVSFTTKNISGKDVLLELQVEGINEIIKRNITIYPENPLFMDIYSSSDNIEASDSSYVNIRVELKDRYGNLVFDDSSTTAKMDILDKYSNIIYTDDNSTTFDAGVAYFKINATKTPGIAYYKISTNLSLDNNTFEITDNNGSLTISGVGETVGQIQTSYFWNKDKIDGKKYNALYTTLLGANYGDITQKDYLAGSLLFDKNNRSLGVTSLLNNPYKTNDIVNIYQNGNIKKIYNSSDLTQDIEFYPTLINDKISFNIYNEALNNYIGNIYYNFGSDTELEICDSSIEGCDLNTEKTSIFAQTISSDYNVYKEDDKLVFYDRFNNKIFSIDSTGSVEKFTQINFSINDSNTNDYLLLDIIVAGNLIGNLGFNFEGSIINVSRDENIFNNKISSRKNSILILINSNLYLSKRELDNNIIYYNDPFAGNNKINDFSSSNMDGYENFINKKGLGWSEGNKTLLEFASGKSIGESVKDYMSFGVINLGDPVISLKKIKEKLPKTGLDRKFDSTIGRLITNNSKVESYEVFDYNNDDKDDLLLIKRDGFLELLENKDIEENFLNLRNVANVIDLGSYDLVKTGNFTGDNYDDIFFVNDKGNPYLLNNNVKDFYRIDLGEQFDLNGKIIISKVFDMDKDGIDDIVTLDDNGSINIFYGGGSGENPIFTKKIISDKYGISLGNDVRNDSGVVYYDGLYQLQEQGDNSELIANSADYLSNSGDSRDQIDFSYDVIDNLVFERLTYSANNDLREYNIEDFADIQLLTDEDLINNTYENKSEYTTFIKSEYSESSGVKVEKIFNDINGGYLKSDDIIEVNIRLTNTSNIVLKNLAYGERLDDIFTLDESSITVDKDYYISFDIPTLTLMIDGLILNPGESVNIIYKTKTKAISYGYINVGLFEKGELGDDIYGDIIFADDNQNCSKDVDIFRSTAKRLYESGTKTPECDQIKSELPESIQQNTLDSNGNGIPDYIDELSNIDNIDNLKNYANEQLGEFNDSSQYDDADSVNEQINSALEMADNIIESISCGFGAASCIATPLNWAPLAPGGDPTMFGYPIGDGLNVDEGLPIFSAITGMQYGPYWGPCVWPPSPLDYTKVDTLGAGGMLGADSATNFFRLFITPTLTGGVGTAICFGGPASVVGISNPKGLSPINPGGNCIVLAKPLALCSDDGSDGDVSSIGFSSVNSNNFDLINGNCDVTNTKANNLLQQDLVDDYYDYRRTGHKSSSLDSNLGESYDAISHGTTLVNDTPLISLGQNGEGGEVNVSVDVSGVFDGNFSDIIKINKSRNFDFPQFLMEWVTRQIEEIANKLTDFPTVFIIFPDFTGIFDGSTKGDDILNVGDKLGGGETIKQAESGINDAYNFISSTPLVKIESEIVNINFPWIDSESLSKTIIDRGKTAKRRKEEIIDFTESVSFGATCETGDIVCEEQNEINSKLAIDAQALVSSLERNISTLEDYKKTPEKIYNWLNVKERYLEQILCNIESISELMGGRISKNGKRFKAWVNLYILIKAVLKSWQGLIDIFTNYEAECHECKNERMDLQTFIWGLIDMIIPKIPVIQFPKWPDIILDLHNIRAGLTINLPEFNITSRPILLPYLPELQLPRVPNVNISLPELPLLPTIEIPDFPDLPNLPTIALPDLPPPPTLPSLLTQLQVILDILKLITKLMCILKQSPFVPEWRAGDQIAFLTERQGYMDFDFLFGISMPQFSFPFVDAIKVTTYVNLEFETDFIVELARQTAMPINNFTNNIVNLLNYNIVDIDLTQYTPSEININIDDTGDINGEIGLDQTIDKKELLALVIVKNFKKLFNYVNDNKDNQISLEEFQKNIIGEVSSEEFISNPKTEQIRKIWDEVNSYTYSKEDKIIEELKQANKDKFNTIKDIINTEIVKNKNIIKDLKESSDKTNIIKVAYIDNQTDVYFYNNKLDIYNQKFIDSAKALINSNETETIRSELKEISNDLINRVKGGLSNYKEGENNKLLSLVNEPSNQGYDSATLCQEQAESQYKYNYEGLYIVENNISYRLFDYIDELDGDEKITIIDFDNDLDEDILYMANGEIFIKENLEIKDDKIYISTNPIILNSNNNKFLNGDIYYEAVNNFKSTISENNYINLSFTNSNNSGINNYRVELFNIVDKFLNSDNTNYIPNTTNKTIIDSFSNIDDLTINREEDEKFIYRKNLGYINNVGNLEGLKLKTYDFKNIKDDISENNMVFLTSGTILYSGGNSVLIKYFEEGDVINELNLKTISIGKYSNIEIKNGIIVHSINGNAFINTKNIINIEGTNILNYVGLPLLPGVQISNINTEYNQPQPRYIEINYYDGSELNLDFTKVINYELYDLGIKSTGSYIRLNRDNDYYYAKIKSFKDNVFSTTSNQILIYPQIEADKNEPELNLNTIIKIPVYQKKIIDLTSFIFEDSGVKNISEVFVDFDLEIDTDGDGNTINDRDTDNINILQSYNSIKIEFGEYDSLFNKKIGIGLIDVNGNIGYKEVDFLVYPPVPQIENYENGIINGFISEKLDDEPINFYRYRGGMITKLENKNNEDFTNTIEGKYDFNVLENNQGIINELIVLNNNNGLSLYNSDNVETAFIDEKTGIIEIKDSNLTIDVMSSNNFLNGVVYPKIILLNNGNEIFYQYVSVVGNNKVNLINSFNEINELSDNGVYISFTDKASYNYYKIPESSTYNPGVFSIYRNTDLEKQELFSIFPDGRINTINEYYSLEYFEFNGNIGYKLIDKHFNKEVARVLLKIEGNYIIR